MDGTFFTLRSPTSKLARRNLQKKNRPRLILLPRTNNYSTQTIKIGVGYSPTPILLLRPNLHSSPVAFLELLARAAIARLVRLHLGRITDKRRVSSSFRTR